MPVDEDRLHAYADWIRANGAKQGTPEWVQVTEAYRNLREDQIRSEKGQLPVDPNNPEGTGFTGGLERFYNDYVAPANAVVGRAATTAATWPWDISAYILNKDRALQDRTMPQTQPGDVGTAEWREAHRQRLNLPNPRPELEPPPTWAPTSGTVAPPPPQIPYAGPALRRVLGIPEMAEDAGYGQKIGEGLLATILGGPKPPTVAGTNAAGAAAVPIGTYRAGAASETAAPATLTQRLAPVAGEVAANVGAVAGEDIGRGIGGEEGATLGSILGGLTPHGVSRLASGPTRSFLAPPGDAASRAVSTLDQLGIPVSPGLVGNRAASTMENTVAGLPLAGIFPANRQTQQFRAFNEAGYRTAGDLAGYEFADRSVPGAGATGTRMRDAAEQGLENLNTRVNQQYDQFYGQPGVEDINVVPNQTRQEADRLIERGTARAERDVQQYMDQDIHSITRSPYDPATVPTGPASTIPPAGTSNVPLPPEAPVAVPIEKFRQTRSEVGKDTKGEKTLQTGEAKKLYSGMTDDMSRELMQHPAMVRAFPDEAARAAQVERMRVLDTEYSNLKQDTGSRYEGRDIPTLERFDKIGNEKDVFTFGSEPPVMSVLARNAPEGQVNRIAGETILNKSGIQPIEGISLSPLTMSSWWNGLDDQAKVAMVNGNMRAYDQLNTMADAGERFRGRHSTVNVAKTAPTLATIGAATGLATKPFQTLTAGLGLGTLGSVASSEPLARYLGRTDPQWAEILRRRGVNAGILADQVYGQEQP